MVISAILVDKIYSEVTDKYVKTTNEKLALSPLIRQGKIRKYTILSTNEDLLLYTGKSFAIINPLYMGIIIMALFGLMWGWTNIGVYIGFAIACASFFISDLFVKLLLVKGLHKIDATIKYRKITAEQVVAYMQEDNLVWDKK